MLKIVLISLGTLGLGALSGYYFKTTPGQAASDCSVACMAKSEGAEISCKLTSPELRLRKETVLASLKQKTLEKRELTDGYAFRFAGSDEIFDELTEFVKTERQCCDFFTFNLSVSGDQSEIWLELRGDADAKSFIDAEMDW